MRKTPSTGETTARPLADELNVAAQAAYDKKATDVVALDLRTVPSFTDFFLICTAQNRRQLRAVADSIDMAMKAAGASPAHIEGNEGSEWILLDYFTMVVHIFTADRRRFYDLERLWGSATRRTLPSPTA